MSIRDTITSAMRKLPKDDPKVQYTRGHPDAHCGPHFDWPKGFCKFYEPSGECRKVLGTIQLKGWCKLFEKAKEA